MFTILIKQLAEVPIGLAFIDKILLVSMSIMDMNMLKLTVISLRRAHASLKLTFRPRLIYLWKEILFFSIFNQLAFVDIPACSE